GAPSCGRVSLAGARHAPKMIYPLVQEMAAPGARVRVPVAVTCRVLGFSEQAYYRWLQSPKSPREIEEEHLIGVLRELHDADPEGGYRVLADVSMLSVTRSASGESGGCARSLACSPASPRVAAAIGRLGLPWETSSCSASSPR